MREVVFDTETTGLDPRSGDRIVEVGCIELNNYLPTGREFQIYINPGRPVSEATVRITGITNDTLRDKKRFEHPDVVDQLMAFFGDDPIVAHNAEFDRGFLNYELELLGRPHSAERALHRYAGAGARAPAWLAGVARRGVQALQHLDPGSRVLHGALLDAQLLAMAYLELRGGRERAFDFASASGGGANAKTGAGALTPRRQRPAPLAPSITPAERLPPTIAFLGAVGTKDVPAIWKKFS
jgi:DNA polymerase-3 subunit epsilon